MLLAWENNFIARTDKVFSQQTARATSMLGAATKQTPLLVSCDLMLSEIFLICGVKSESNSDLEITLASDLLSPP